MKQEQIRLQKYLADRGVASRRKAEELIQQGLVKVNGRPVKLGDKVNPARDLVTVNGKKVAAVKEKPCYIMLYKPRGYVTTLSDEMDRRCVADLVKDVGKRVYPVGRLDRESEGMLLLTNDGAFAQAITHPSNHIPKTYRVTVRPGVTEEQIDRLSTGVEIDGRKTMPAQVTLLTEEEGRAVLSIVISEGRNRQIRKMCEAVGLEVARLKRTAIGQLRLGMLKPGKWRYLRPEDLQRLMPGMQTASGGRPQRRRR
nr:pseudouridine synthase [uncultured Solibaculum sp.]